MLNEYIIIIWPPLTVFLCLCISLIKLILWVKFSRQKAGRGHGAWAWQGPEGPAPHQSGMTKEVYGESGDYDTSQGTPWGLFWSFLKLLLQRTEQSPFWKLLWPSPFWEARVTGRNGEQGFFSSCQKKELWEDPAWSPCQQEPLADWKQSPPQTTAAVEFSFTSLYLEQLPIRLSITRMVSRHLLQKTAQMRDTTAETDRHPQLSHLCGDTPSPDGSNLHLTRRDDNNWPQGNTTELEARKL